MKVVVSSLFYLNDCCAGVRAGEEVQAAEVSLRPGAGAPGQPHPPHPHPGNYSNDNIMHQHCTVPCQLPHVMWSQNMCKLLEN